MTQLTSDPTFDTSYGGYQLYSGGGYETSGQMYRSLLKISAYDDDEEETVTLKSHSFLMVADNITQDAWLYDYRGAAGSLSFAYANEFMSSMKNTETLITKWFLQMGSVADQSFASGGHDKVEGALLYIGDGDYD